MEPKIEPLLVVTDEGRGKDGAGDSARDGAGAKEARTGDGTRDGDGTGNGDRTLVTPGGAEADGLVEGFVVVSSEELVKGRVLATCKATQRFLMGVDGELMCYRNNPNNKATYQSMHHTKTDG
jgi:hypothetical protein